MMVGIAVVVFIVAPCRRGNERRRDVANTNQVASLSWIERRRPILRAELPMRSMWLRDERDTGPRSKPESAGVQSFMRNESAPNT